jgi:hypothetical protein
MIFGRTTSSQMGLGPIILVKLHSFFVAAEAACSKGDFPVATVEATLVAVIGFAAAAVTTVVPAELAAAVPLVPSAAKGAAHPCNKAKPRMDVNQTQCFKGIQSRVIMNYLALQTELKTPATQSPLGTGSNLLSGVLLSDTTFPDPLLPENSLKAIGR